jgi:hypothetical protein
VVGLLFSRPFRCIICLRTLIFYISIFGCKHLSQNCSNFTLWILVCCVLIFIFFKNFKFSPISPTSHWSFESTLLNLQVVINFLWFP